MTTMNYAPTVIHTAAGVVWSLLLYAWVYVGILVAVYLVGAALYYAWWAILILALLYYISPARKRRVADRKRAVAQQRAAHIERMKALGVTYYE